MIGAIIGDVVGSRFEFNNHRSKEFKLFDKTSTFTDDTVMTCAVLDYLMNKKFSIDYYLKKWALKYPNRGYGINFIWWVHYGTEPYDSCGNGAAMRISPVAWFANSEKEVRELSREVTKVTHNHPEGIKGAEVTAMCIYKALNCESKEEIRKYIVSEYPEIETFNYHDLRKNYKFNELCQTTVPQALYCFLISVDFEDCLRNCISIGGDSDTLAAIACSVAEAFYCIPKKLIKKTYQRLPTEITNLLDEFYKS